MCVNDLKLGEKAFVRNVFGDEKLVKRLSALGCTEGCQIEVVNRAPFGDPIVLSLRGSSMAIRKKDAGSIMVEASF
ncbi:ferrous iron transport protein A [Proteiniclasticum sp. SCR006]|uniref:Ferrous iron transport protein A n=1 Tax=Proteiniclasticum aestuarii TaxID=2817862 RepID=A0A939H480_9CLOT|nr:ferrous iron transport protein A [Proteiniclasticum aestuarii]MBO1263882.1 ferrous iron transport protein A [Proteiniclasticum aestuarii]